MTDAELAQTRVAVAHAVESGGILACSLEWALTFQDLLDRLSAAERVCEAAERRAQLDPTENMVLTIALAQIERGDDVPPNTTAALVFALARIAGREGIRSDPAPAIVDELLAEIDSLRKENAGTDRVLWNPGRDTFDEIVVHNCTIHVEQMTDQAYWMGVYKGEKQSLHVNFSHRGRVPLRATFYDDSDPATPWTWDEDREHS